MKLTPIALSALICLTPLGATSADDIEGPKTMPFKPIPEALIGEWKLGPYFQKGIGPSLIIDPETILGKSIGITNKGYIVDGKTCNAKRITWYGSTESDSLLQHTSIPLEERFEYDALHIVSIQCSNINIMESSNEDLPLILSNFKIYYNDETITMTYSPQHGPEFILKPTQSSSTAKSK